MSFQPPAIRKRCLSAPDFTSLSLPTDTKFAPPAHFQTSKINNIIFLQMKVKILPSSYMSVYTLLAHSPHPVCSARSFSTSILLHSLILHIHIHSQTVLDKGEKMHMKSSLNISSILTVPVFMFKFRQYAPSQKRQICVCYVCSLHMKIKKYYEWTSSLLLSEVSILAQPSHSCLLSLLYYAHQLGIPSIRPHTDKYNII